MINQKPYFWITCDGCGANAQEDSDYSAWADKDAAEDGAVNSDWSSNSQGKHHCPNCAPFCEKCHEPAGPLSGERDNLCPLCFLMAQVTDGQTISAAGQFEIRPSL